MGFLSKKCINHKHNQKAAEKKKSSRKSGNGNNKQDSGRVGGRKSGQNGRKSLPNAQEFEKDLQFFKSVVLNDTNVKMIESKLKSTAAARMKLMQNKQKDFLENFPFFSFIRHW